MIRWSVDNGDDHRRKEKERSLVDFVYFENNTIFTTTTFDASWKFILLTIYYNKCRLYSMLLKHMLMMFLKMSVYFIFGALRIGLQPQHIMRTYSVRLLKINIYSNRKLLHCDVYLVAMQVIRSHLCMAAGNSFRWNSNILISILT